MSYKKPASKLAEDRYGKKEKKGMSLTEIESLFIEKLQEKYRLNERYLYIRIVLSPQSLQSFRVLPCSQIELSSHFLRLLLLLLWSSG